MKLKLNLKTDVEAMINNYAKHLGLYNEFFENDYERQCSGYHAFRYLCLCKQEIPDNIGFGANGTVHPKDFLDIDQYASFQSIHAAIRQKAFAHVKHIRRQIFKYNE